VQVAAVAFFVVVLFSAVQRRAALPWADIFFRLDPLAASTAMLSAREWLPRLAPAFATVVTALVVGRVWCGWICPLGTLLEWARFRSARRLERHVPERLRVLKYLVLGVLVVMAAFGSLTFLVVDPISLLTRTTVTSFVPSFVYAVDAVEVALVRWGVDSSAADALLRRTVLPLHQPYYPQAAFLLVLFLVTVGLNVLTDRFWCRYLCPLGALLGLVSKVQLLRPIIGSSCVECGACVRACRLGAIRPRLDSQNMGSADAGRGDLRVVSSECTMCLDCFTACPQSTSLSLASTVRSAPWQEYQPARRDFLTAVVVGMGAVVLLGAGVWRVQPSAGLIRPPGAQDEDSFLSRCLRCSECMAVCPTSGLQPAPVSAGLEGLWTPILVSRLGFCEYSCTACGQACPSGAIPRLTLDVKRGQVLGLAVIDKDRCLPWAQSRPCIVCQEMCPVADKAIVLGAQTLITRPDGTQDYLARPRVVAQRCIGCGICEYRCPVEGPAAIVVVPVNPLLASRAGGVTRDPAGRSS
jgi:polyferredoxin/Pyruvate/2-oxoacid:ferredoxin oxidoreductase delta subunit